LEEPPKGAGHQEEAKAMEWAIYGNLHKGGEAGTWKAREFGLRRDEGKLYYYRVGRLRHLKGVIELGKIKVYDLQESYVGRPHCFQLIPCDDSGQVTASQDQVIFLAAESATSKKLWLETLSPYCNWNGGPLAPRSGQLEVNFVTFGNVHRDKLNVVRTVHVRLLEGILRSTISDAKDPDPYCVIKVGDANMAKSEVCLQTASPVWNQIFTFESGCFHFPPVVSSLAFLTVTASFLSTIGVFTAAYLRLISS